MTDEGTGVVDPRDARIAELEAQLKAAQKPSGWVSAKARLGKAGAAVVAAFTSAEAVKAEKNLAVLAATRLLLMVGAGAATSDGVYKLLQALGWVS